LESRRSRGLPIKSEAWSPSISEELRGHAVAPRRAASRMDDYMGLHPAKVNTRQGAKQDAKQGPKIEPSDAGMPHPASQVISVA
jgi:hypothetical protein